MDDSDGDGSENVTFEMLLLFSYFFVCVLFYFFFPISLKMLNVGEFPWS